MLAAAQICVELLARRGRVHRSVLAVKAMPTGLGATPPWPKCAAWMKELLAELPGRTDHTPGRSAAVAAVKSGRSGRDVTTVVSAGRCIACCTQVLCTDCPHCILLGRVSGHELNTRQVVLKYIYMRSGFWSKLTGLQIEITIWVVLENSLMCVT